jgi:hypothetical protein
MTKFRSLQNMPLAINVIGPMAFNKSGKVLDIWLPILSKKYRHQLAIGTNVESQELGDLSEYSLSDPNPQCHSKPSGHQNPPPGKPSIPYQDTAVNYPPSSFYVRFTLPRPQWIIGLSPVSCKIYKGGTSPAQFENVPVGFRLFYERAGLPVLESRSDPQFTYPLQFDPANAERQLEAFISYSPYNFSDYGHHEAKNDFAKLTRMLGLKVNIDFEFPFIIGDSRVASKPDGEKKWKILNGPAKDCKSPNMLLTELPVPTRIR